MRTRIAWVIVITISAFFSCKKDYVPNYAQAKDYYPLAAGRVWFYRLDSTTIPPFGTELIVHSYHLKDSVGVSFSDNAGRTSWPVYRFITDTLEESSWQNISTYYVTPTNNDVEVVDDNNLRFIKLISPISAGKSWKGNRYIDTRSATSPFQYLDDWDFIYDSVNLSYTTLAGSIDSSVVVHQRDETSPEGDFDPQYYQQRNYSVEVYAYNTGLIYKNFLHWTWQPTPSPARFEDDSYGIILNLIRIKQ
ncbi:MAG: hypothetical protein JO072_15440 [Parafilimonas sp.]|nr:hypothetical protein [Parafilimonas sp.]